jgi:D-alanyl-lipoteichoic acid acyltransferase DltB (MBOAT superfamily)
MLFNSFNFLIFSPVVTLLYFLLPHRFRWFHLLMASCVFYMFFKPIYILILVFTIVIDYFAGIYLEKITDKKKKRGFLILSICANVGVLAVFKYYNFLNQNLTALLGAFQLANPVPFLDIILPIGLSFHTFQAMSYTIEVFRGRQKAEKHFGIYALYVMFYPQLVAGPIERPQNLIHQFYERHYFEYNRVMDGLKLMLWGMFKKVVIADRLAVYVTAVYGNHERHSGISLLVATVFFAFQVYCDFSGYSDIAIGSARVMGFKLMTNFNRPFISKSMSEFWTRWHISLSSWFKDYLYIPLGGNRVKMWRWFLNLFIVFSLSGLWHGADWNYVSWGAMTGIIIITGILLGKLAQKTFGAVKRPAFISSKFMGFLQIIWTFALFNFTLIFFRARDLGASFHILDKIFTNPGKLFVPNPSQVIYSLFGILVLLVFEMNKKYVPSRFSFYFSPSRPVRVFSYAMVLILILMIGVFDGSQFIYFQF